MRHAEKKLRPPTKHHGGKSYLARRIISLLPAHDTYIEPFVGAGSVLINRDKCHREVACDLDADLMNFWTTLKFWPDAIFERIATIDYTEENFVASKSWIESDDRVLNAVGYLVRSRFSRGGMGNDFAWSDRLRGTKRPGGAIPGDANAWDTIRQELPAIADRIKDVDFRCCNVIDLIPEFDSPNVLGYFDPPYLIEKRVSRKVYKVESTPSGTVDDDRLWHMALLKTLLDFRGMVAISGYDSDLYADTLKGWDRVTFDMPNNSGQTKTKQRRTEVVWRNPACINRIIQNSRKIFNMPRVVR